MPPLSSPDRKKLPAPSSTALQRLQTTNEGALRARPLRLRKGLGDEEEEPSSPAQWHVTFSVTGQTLSTRLGGEFIQISAPLSHLYHSQLYVQVQDSQTKNVVYRGSYAVDMLPIHQETCIPIRLKLTPTAEEAVMVDSSNTAAAATTAPPPPPEEELTLHVQCVLEGPCRSEVLKLQQALNTWLGLVDRAEGVLREVWKKASPQIPNAAKKKQALLLLIPAFLSILVPVGLGCIIVSPIAIGFCVLFFPIMIPVVVGICLVVLFSILATGLMVSLLYASTNYGRHQLYRWWKQQSTLQEYWNELKGPRFGLQTFVYATGPRPTPVTLMRTQLPTEKWRRLCVSLTIDGVGSFSYLLPLVGEAFDVVWAPTQTVLIMALYQHVSPNMSYVSFAEEMLPFLDVLPSATTGWIMEFGPSIMEDAKFVAQNPSSVQRLLWGGSSGGRNNRGPPPTARPMRHA